MYSDVRSLESTGIVIQARMGSTRLYGKALLQLGNTDMIGYLVSRLVKCQKSCQIIMAVPSSKENTPFKIRAKELNCSHFSGSEHDVLFRYFECAKFFNLSTIVRLTSDNPFVPAHMVFEMIDLFNSCQSIDYLSTTLDSNNPVGLHIEIFSRKALDLANLRSNDYPMAREHVTPYIYNNPDLFNCRAQKSKFCLSPYRLTVDYIEDLQFARILASRLSYIQDPTIPQIIGAIDRHPSLFTINSMHKKLPTSPLS